jgi:hypothetical protein
VPSQSSDFTRHWCCYFGVWILLSKLVRSVQEFVSFIIFVGFPREVIGINARMVTSAARMRCFVIWCRRRAVMFLANESRDVGSSVSYVDLGIPGRRPAERPNQAFCAIMKRRNVFNEFYRFMVRSPAAKWHAMASEPIGMRVTVSMRIVGLIASGDRALSSARLKKRVGIAIFEKPCGVLLTVTARTMRLAAVGN